MERAPRIALIMPFLNEGVHLPAVLESLAAQTIDRGRVYLIATDNGSTDDGTKTIEAWLRDTGIAGRVLRVEFRSIPYALNRALQCVGTGDYVVRLDAHAIYPPDYLERIIQAFEALPEDVWCVGGIPKPLIDRRFGYALHAALFNNPMGLGRADYRDASEFRSAASVYLGAWRPGVLHRVGGYDVRWRANEDSELAERIREAGGRVVCIPVHPRNIITRGAWGALIQRAYYGFWRAQTFKRHPRAIRARHLAPPAALLATLVLSIGPVRLALVPLYAIYAALTLLLRAPGERAAVTAASLVYFPLVQAAYACGLIVGAFIGTGRSRLPVGAGRAAPAP